MRAGKRVAWWTPLTSSLLAASLLVGAGARAASEDECAGWLCIVVGFAPPECAAAHRAMRQRLLEFKSPLPSFGACSADGNSNGYEVHLGVAARIGLTDPPQYVMGTSCLYDDGNRVEGDRLPIGCTGTYRAIGVSQYGVQVGEVFFVRKQNPPKKSGPNNFDDKD